MNYFTVIREGRTGESFLAKGNNLPPLSYIGELEVVNIVYATLLHQAIRKPLLFFHGNLGGTTGKNTRPFL